MIASAASGTSSREMLIDLFGRWPRAFYFRTALAAIFAYAVCQRFALPLDPLADPDTWGYLSPALRKLTGAEFGHTHGRNFLYPGFLFLLLRAFNDFRAITIAQHLLGLLAGGIFFLTWRRVRVFVSNPRIGRAGYDALGLFGTALFLCASDTVRFETQLRPEGISAFLISINLYVIVQFIACCFLENRRTAAIAYGIAIVFISLVLASVKPSFWFVAIVNLLPVSAFFFQHGAFRQKLALGVGATVSAALLLLPEHFLSRTDEMSRTFLPTTLFAAHANLIRDQMTEDLKSDMELPYPRDWLQRIQIALSAEIEKSHAARPAHYSSLGFDPDYLMYNESSIAAQLRQEFGSNVSALCAFYRFYYARIWKERPLIVVKKIGRQMAIFYRPMGPLYNRGKARALAGDYEFSLHSLDIEPYRKVWTAYPPAARFMHRTASFAQTAPVVEQPGLIRVVLALLMAAYLPLLLSAVTLGGVVLWREGEQTRLCWLAGFVLFAYSFNAASCLEVAVVNSLEIVRYISVQFLFTLFAQMLAAWFCLEFALERRAWRQRPILGIGRKQVRADS